MTKRHAAMLELIEKIYESGELLADFSWTATPESEAWAKELLIDQVGIEPLSSIYNYLDITDKHCTLEFFAGPETCDDADLYTFSAGVEYGTFCIELKAHHVDEDMNSFDIRLWHEEVPIED
ncbi:MAG: hypothetical protein IJP24_05480 [Firmicutes bacterium]|nr:hypothetical protein [Bacillota bacterium]